MFTRSHSIETARRHHQARHQPVDESQQRLLPDHETEYATVNVADSGSEDDVRVQTEQSRQSQPGGLPPKPRTRWLQAGRVVQAQIAMQQDAERAGVPHTHLPGSVQGIDLKRSPQEWSWLSTRWADECCIMCVDFSPDKVSVHPNLHNDQLAGLLSQPRPSWAGVRWINVDGLNWNVIQSLALHYDLHPLAVEDVVHIPQRIKADFYEDFMYASLHLITLAKADTSSKPAVEVVTSATLVPPVPPAGAAPVPSPRLHTPFSTQSGAVDLPLPGSPASVQAGEEADVVEGLRAEVVLGVDTGVAEAGGEGQVTTPHFKDSLNGLPGRRLGRTTSVTRAFGESHRHQLSPASANGKTKSRKEAPGAPRAGAAQQRGPAASNTTMTASKMSAGVPVHRQQVSLFLLNNNTIISIFETAGAALTRPLLQQLREPKTLARDATDASYLMCLLLDALADCVYPVVDAYSSIIEGYEQRILADHPDAGMTRELHLVQGDLATLRRTLLPSLHLVTGLRSHANEARGVFSSARGGQGATSPATTPAAKQGATDISGPTPALHPLVSRLTKTYLGDVQDHLTSLMDALDSQTEGCRDLIDLAFNLIALRTNGAMQALTVVSVLFLPLTFLAGIYGMNFDNLPELHWTYGYAYFWGMCVFIVVAFIALSYRMGLVGSTKDTRK